MVLPFYVTEEHKSNSGSQFYIDITINIYTIFIISVQKKCCIIANVRDTYDINHGPGSGLKEKESLWP